MKQKKCIRKYEQGGVKVAKEEVMNDINVKDAVHVKLISFANFEIQFQETNKS